MDIQNASVDKLLSASNDIRRGKDTDPADAFAIAKRLAAEQRLEHAQRLAEHIAHEPGAHGPELEAAQAIEHRQKWALWTSQNPDRPDDQKHDDALAILDGIRGLAGGEPLADSVDPETLGIAGGICKRKWRIDGRRETLEQSLHYYERGAAAGVAKDSGYNAINAAFVLDVLAAMEGADGDDKRAQARSWRQQVLDELAALADEPPKPGGAPRREQRWFHETLAEAAFGLRDYSGATTHLKKAYEGDVEPWERETTARQFALLARLAEPEARTSADFEASAAWGVLRDVYGGDTAAGAGSLFAGKFGLGLSGGGFRASFFHVGILAALAERDMLRHVEALSCVSGGSILGAHYYLEVRQLLQSKADGDITREDWIALVERLAHDFLAGVQQNVRTRVGSNFVDNLRMMFQPGYTRTNRLGELYEEHLYDRVADDKQRVMRELRVKPLGDEKCNPKYDNWRRQNKIPILILNATTVNTGHNWQFTATWMGEPPAHIDSQVDGNYRLRRMYYTEAPDELKNVSIGQAAAASSCVPGLFTPIELRDLYPNITVRLVDGGVHDNQGIFGLMEQNCNVLLVSDASGQMSAVDSPSDGSIGVLLRTTSMLQSRVRTAVYREIESRKKSGRLKGLLFLHLKKELEVEDKDWIGCDNPKEIGDAALRRQRGPLTSYGVLKDLQRRIAGLRTDLDSFSEVEAFALMASGCKMARTTIAGAIEGFPADSREHDWEFLAIEPALRTTQKESFKQHARLLDVGALTMLKVWKLSGLLRALSIALGVAAGVGLLWMVAAWRGEPFLSPKGLAAALGTAVLGIAVASLGLSLIVRIVQYRKTVHQILVGTVLALFGWLVTGLHLLVFDPWFLKRGRLPGGGRPADDGDAG